MSSDLVTLNDAGLWRRIVRWFRGWPDAWTPVCSGADCPVCAEITSPGEEDQ